MINQIRRKQLESRVWPHVQTPAQYVGGERNIVVKDHRTLRGKLAIGFPDAYTIGMSHHGLQVLYSLMNRREDWCAERVFTPWPDMEQLLREQEIPLYTLETFTALSEFDVVGLSLQYEISSPNVLTMIDLGGIPLESKDRTMADPLMVAGGPCCQNPEPMADYFDVMITGDGEPALPVICDLWLKLKNRCRREDGSFADGEAGRRQREDALAEVAKTLEYAYVPRFYQPTYANGRIAGLKPTRDDVPATIAPSVIKDLDGIPLPTSPIVPYIDCVHDRIAIEIMRGCPHLCRFCQSTVIKRPLRIREVETIVDAAWESYLNTGHNEISILSLSSSDYPHFEPLVKRLHEVFKPLGVNISVPSLRVNDQLRSLPQLIGTDRRSSLTLAPEVARDDMREQIRKKIKNSDLIEGCRNAFQNGFDSVKLYFMCGLPGEREVDLDGIVDLAETIATVGKEVRGRYARVTASVSNFVPKAHTPYQWNGMRHREYFKWAHKYLWNRRKIRSVNVKCHNIETSLLEGVLSRGDRRTGHAIRMAWERGARMDGWTEYLDPERWWTAINDAGIDIERQVHENYEMMDKLPWDHVNVKFGRAYLEKEQGRATVQLAAMANAV
ncbi:TIGR03960 family B12-binding radical SAM protein [Roseiconus lacunae]|uniref:TIGR03960 family B12-binding radical SAM protein n=1 Tax=Roseiconus lacunae TaxID=2605694 RepID=A0ABT7PIG2_9BACT|nr:TIGR03960 family B12-binding radical SAM protein [Roseiconus lacunae]MCD0458401.1 TIGR03960 family B12-binding radical SAM protein [Roseiconus lacunae]MDM4016289.1 TIGR03960 family B12-binding radical SAM protein [Roseiconus lacunae]WRQ52108.1 TIGR03960 family B12-binding radical SAM protein [Stieleria sp. HD01]